MARVAAGLAAVAFVALAAVYAPWFLLLMGIVFAVATAAIWVARRVRAKPSL